MPTYNPAMQRASIADVPADVHGLISKKTAQLDGVAVTQVTFQAGARWSKDLKAYAGTDLCELPHVALVTAGTLRVVLREVIVFETCVEPKRCGSGTSRF